MRSFCFAFQLIRMVDFKGKCNEIWQLRLVIPWKQWARIKIVSRFGFSHPKNTSKLVCFTPDANIGIGICRIVNTGWHNLKIKRKRKNIERFRPSSVRVWIYVFDWWIDRGAKWSVPYSGPNPMASAWCFRIFWNAWAGAFMICVHAFFCLSNLPKMSLCPCWCLL